MVNVLQRNLWSQTLHHMGVLGKRRAMVLFYRWKNWDNNSAAPLPHPKEQKKTGQAPPMAELCPLPAERCDSDLQWALGMGTEPWGWDPPAEPRAQKPAWKGMQRRHWWGNSSSLLAKGKKAKPQQWRKLQGKSTVLQRISDIRDVGAASRHKIHL